jgi:hypothetical protein
MGKYIMHHLVLSQQAKASLVLHLLIVPSTIGLICSSSRLNVPSSSSISAGGNRRPQIVSFQQQRLATSLKSSCNDNSRRSSILLSAGLFSGFFGSINDNGDGEAKAVVASPPKSKRPGPTNEVIKVVNGIKHKRLGGGDIVVSELGLGTQRWCSTDFNAPNEEDCFNFMDEAILNHGVNLIDTAEGYPIPSSRQLPEGTTETVIGKWMKSRSVPRSKVIIATKITGGRNVTTFMGFEKRITYAFMQVNVNKKW